MELLCKMMNNLPLVLRKTLSMPSLLQRVRSVFGQLDEPRSKRKPLKYSRVDTLMSGLAVFSLKYSSLLDFDRSQKEERVRMNLSNLYGVKKAPCDTHMRTVLDIVDPQNLRGVFSSLIQEVQRQGELESYRYLGGYLCSIDGTGQFSSTHLHCPDCCEKHHRNGETEYYHQLLQAALVHPDKKVVLPLFPEAITGRDGNNKNDCEQNAGKRLLPAIKKAFPRLKLIIVEDALSGNGPHIEALEKQGFSYIIRVKEGSQGSLLEAVYKRTGTESMDGFTVQGEEGIQRGYRFMNAVPLNKSNPDKLVNYLYYWEVDKKGKERTFRWITDIPLSRHNVYEVMRAGRARWKIENETFNTLKNLGYHFEHNYGHGKKHLSTVFATLMMLAFLIDQIQELSCRFFQAAREKMHTKKALWHKIRSLFLAYFIENWTIFYQAIVFGHQGGYLQPDIPNTS